jgi:hypothetical protein
MIEMRSRYLPIALPLLAIAATPAAARDIVFAPGTGEAVAIDDYDNEPQPDSEDRSDSINTMADKMGDPAVQAGISAAIEHAAGAMMNMPIGPMAEAIERARPGTVSRRIHRDSTIADIAGRDSRYLPQELGDRSREAMGMMSGFARAMAYMMPEFERMGREMEESFRAAKAEAKRNRN